MAVLEDVEHQDDINKILQYFSYEHFFVIYCKFWDLDVDRDFLLSRDDVLKYQNHSLTFRIVDRIFAQPRCPFASKKTNQMNYEDFVSFILSGTTIRRFIVYHITQLCTHTAEEDKTSLAGLQYWFACCDLDGNGVLTQNELKVSYRCVSQYFGVTYA